MLIFAAYLSACLLLQYVAAVVNTGQTKKMEESVKTSFENKDNEKTVTNTVDDLVAENSEETNRREASAVSYKDEPPSSSSLSSGHFNLPLPVYRVPNAPSSNRLYPAPPSDIPPPPPKLLPSLLYGTPSFGKTYGVPQINPLPQLTKGYGSSVGKYGAGLLSSNQFSTNLIPSKPIYGPPKHTFGPIGKPLKFHKNSLKYFGLTPPKPIRGTSLNFKDNFSYSKINNNNNNFNTNSFGGSYTNSLSLNNAFPSLYSGISSINHQYGAPILAQKPTISLQYDIPNSILSTQYGIPSKIVSEPPVVAYGPPQPLLNPRPPHPGAPAPPTPPDIKYDGWQPIPGLVSKGPSEEIYHITAQGSGYNGIPPQLLNDDHDQLSGSYSAPTVKLDVSLENSLLDQPEISYSYEVPLNSVTGSKSAVSDSYSAPLGTVTGSGGIVASSGAEAHGGSTSISHSDSHGNPQILELSSVGIDHSADIQATKSIEYEINSHDTSDSISGSSFKILENRNKPQLGNSLSGSYGSDNVYSSIGSFDKSSKNSIKLHGYTSSSLSGFTKGLVPPSGVYGAQPTSQYGIPLLTNNYGNYKPPKRPVTYKEEGQHAVLQNIAKESHNKGSYSFGGSPSSFYLPPPLPAGLSKSYGIPSNTGAISFQNLVHGSSTAGIDLQQSALNIEGASALALTSYNSPVSSNYGISSSDKEVHVGLDYSLPPHTVDLTQGKQSSPSTDCTFNNEQYQPSLAYGVPSAGSYNSPLSSLTKNIAPSQGYDLSDVVAPQPQVSVPLHQYGAPDLAHSSSIKSEAKINSIKVGEETHGKNYGKSVAESFGPNSELVESQSIDLNNIPLQGNFGSYTLQIQSADGSEGQISHPQVLNDGLLESILQAIEQPGQQGQNNKYPIILQPSIERNNYSVNETLNNSSELSPASEIREAVINTPENNKVDELESGENEETLQLLDTSNIALYYKKDDTKKIETGDKGDSNTGVNGKL